MSQLGRLAVSHAMKQGNALVYCEAAPVTQKYRYDWPSRLQSTNYISGIVLLNLLDRNNDTVVETDTYIKSLDIH